MCVYVCVCMCMCIYEYIHTHTRVCVNISVLCIGLMSRVFANDLGHQGSIPDPVIPKTQKMVLDLA